MEKIVCHSVKGENEETELSLRGNRASNKEEGGRKIQAKTLVSSNNKQSCPKTTSSSRNKKVITELVAELT